MGSSSREHRSGVGVLPLLLLQGRYRVIYLYDPRTSRPVVEAYQFAIPFRFAEVDYPAGAWLVIEYKTDTRRALLDRQMQPLILAYGIDAIRHHFLPPGERARARDERRRKFPQIPDGTFF